MHASKQARRYDLRDKGRPGPGFGEILSEQRLKERIERKRET